MHKSMPDSLPIAARYRAGDALLVNAILRRCMDGRVRVASNDLTLAKCQHLQERPAPAMVQIDLKVGTEPLAVLMSQSTTELLWGPVCWSALDPAMQRLFVADQLSPMLAQWTKTLDLALTVEAIDPIPGVDKRSDTATIALDIRTHHQQTGRIMLAASDKLAKQIAAAIENGSLPLQQSITTLHCSLIVGYQQLNDRDLLRLSTGAVILAKNRLGQALPAPSTSTPLTVEVNLTEHQLCLAHAEAGKIRVITPDALSPAHEADPAMNENATPATAPDAQDDTRLPLTFRLGKVTLTTSDLQAVTPGHVFSADINPAEPVVEICLGDECIGRGRLVGVGDQLGIEVTAWGAGNE